MLIVFMTVVLYHIKFTFQIRYIRYSASTTGSRSGLFHDKPQMCGFSSKIVKDMNLCSNFGASIKF